MGAAREHATPETNQRNLHGIVSQRRPGGPLVDSATVRTSICSPSCPANGHSDYLANKLVIPHRKVHEIWHNGLRDDVPGSCKYKFDGTDLTFNFVADPAGDPCTARRGEFNT